MTMGAEYIRKGETRTGLGESGQSLLEFLFMLPVMIAFIVILVRVNSTIQISIVNQKYARAQTTFLTYNSAHYPERRLYIPPGSANDNFIRPGFNRMTIGIADKPISETDYKAVASTSTIVRDKSTIVGGEGPSQQEPTERAVVRVRTTVSLCTRTIALGPGILATAENIGEKTIYPFCAGKEGG